MQRRAFTLVETILVVVVVGVAAAAGLVSAANIIERARRDDQARAAVAQIRKLRADALAAGEGAAVEVGARAGGGVRVTTATVPRQPGLPQCASYLSRATKLVEREYDLVDVSVDRPAQLLCFDAGAFRLLAEDGVSLAPAPANLAIEVEGGGPVLGSLSVSPQGSFTSTFEMQADAGPSTEGLAATVNVPPTPTPDDPARHVVEPRALEPELPVVAAPPPDPTTPAGEPPIDPLPAPSGAPPPAPAPPACTTDADCPGGYSCVSGNCEPTTPACSSDADCPDVEFGCDIPNGTCTKLCNTALCPNTPMCSTMCQQNQCCTTYGCLCV